MSSLYTRANAVVPQTPAADYTTKTGSLVDLAAGVATISTSATVPAKGVILEGAPTTGQVSVGILGALPGTVRLKASGNIAAGAQVCQHSDGTVVTDAGSSARVAVGIAIEGGASGDLIEVATFTPRIYAS